MKKRFLGLWLVSLFLLGGARFLLADTPFEGEIDFRQTAKIHKADIAYLIKGNKFRLDTLPRNTNVSFILDMENHRITMLAHARKIYMVFPAPENKSEMTGSLEETGKQAEILGHPCSEWLYKGAKVRCSIWAATGLGKFFTMGNQGDDNAWAEVFTQKGLFPLKVVYMTTEGRVAITLEATKIEAKPLDGELFTAPSDYQEVKVKAKRP